MSPITDDTYIRLIQNQKIISLIQQELVDNNQKILNEISKRLTELEHRSIQQTNKILFAFDIEDLSQKRKLKNKEYLSILESNVFLLARTKKLILTNELFTKTKLLIFLENKKKLT